MKTPLEDSVSTDVVRMCIVDFADEWPSLVILISELCNEVDQLRFARAAQPGAPREDGEYIVRTSAIESNVLIKRKNGVNTIALVGFPIPDDKILCHRKSGPLEVPK